MKTKTINLFLFSELNENQKAKVIENYRDINTDYDWYNFTLDDWTGRLGRQGFEAADIHFSGFYSQGDGACFSANVNLKKFLSGRRIFTKYANQAKKLEDSGDLITIKTSGQYTHEFAMYIVAPDYITSELEALILEEAREQARKIYKELQAEYENLISDEEIAETLEANGYLFNEETLKIDN